MRSRGVIETWLSFHICIVMVTNDALKLTKPEMVSHKTFCDDAISLMAFIRYGNWKSMSIDDHSTTSDTWLWFIENDVHVQCV